MTYTERQKQALEKMPLYNSQCVACGDAFPSNDTVRVKCGDVYCNNCLKNLFRLSTKDQSLFPPSCCREEISLQLIAPAMSYEDLEMFHAAQIEFATTDRTYCSNHQCGDFIPPIQVVEASYANCSHCGTRTCVHCKGSFHVGECPEDEALQAALALAEELRWQRCHVCRTMVELTHGCYHMTYDDIDC
jgi:hypothetical protein